MNLENLRRLAASSSKVLYAAAIMHIAGFILLSQSQELPSGPRERLHSRKQRHNFGKSETTSKVYCNGRAYKNSDVWWSHYETAKTYEAISEQDPKEWLKRNWHQYLEFSWPLYSTTPYSSPVRTLWRFLWRTWGFQVSIYQPPTLCVAERGANIQYLRTITRNLQVGQCWPEREVAIHPNGEGWFTTLAV